MISTLNLKRPRWQQGWLHGILLLLLALAWLPLRANAASFAHGHVEDNYSSRVGVVASDPDCLDGIQLGPLPPGLNATFIGCNLYLMGTPTVAGTFTVQATPMDGSPANTFSLVIYRSVNTISVSSSTAAATLGSNVTFTANLTRGNGATGTVNFLDNGTPIGSSAPSGGIASLTVNTLNAGSHAIRAVYSGDANYESSSSAGTADVVVSQATPSVALAASPASVSVGASVTLTATLSGGSAPGGTVTFKDGATTLGTGTVSGGTASFTTASLGVGSHALTAVYGGDSNNGAATSSAVTVSVGQATPALTLAASPASVSVGGSVTLTATLSGGSAPGGTVTFKDGATTLGTGTVSGGTASFSTASLGVGSHALTAVYGGDSNNGAATSSAVTVSVGQATPALTLAASPASVSVGASVTLTATLSGGSAPGGTVTFKDGATTLGTGTVSGGTASFTTAALGLGSHALTAVYGGDAKNSGATSSVTTVTVGNATPTVTLAVSTTSISVGASVTLTATLSGGSAPGGSVTFKDGATTLGTGTVSGRTASFTTASLGVGSHSLTAVYGGDSNNSAATSSPLTVSVGQATPTVSLAASATSVSAGGSVTLTATLAGGRAPGGSVTFMDGAVALGSVSLSGGSASFSTSALAVGSHALTAVYGGDANNNANASGTVSVSVGQAAPALALAASASAVHIGQPVTLTATLAGGSAPGGSITFKDGATTLGSVALSGGRASFSLAALTVGSHQLSAVYGGDASNKGATSATLAVSVGQATPTVALAASADTVRAGQPVTFTATLSGGSAPAGTVTFKDGAATLGSVTLSGASASFTTGALAAGSHALTAVYGGDANNSGAASAALNITVNAIAPSVSKLDPASGPAAGGTSVTISGINLADATAVSFGGANAAITANSGTSITVTAPAHAAGHVTVVVATANGSVAVGNAFLYEAKADPTRDPVVMGTVAAQTQSARLFTTNQIGNFTQRLTTLHSGGQARPVFGLSFHSRSAADAASQRWARGGDIVIDDAATAQLRRYLRKTSAMPAPTAREERAIPSAGGQGFSNLPELPGDTPQQPLALWIGGAVEIGDARDGSARVQTNGVSFGGDYRLNHQLTLGLGAGYSHSKTRLGDDGSGGRGQGVTLAAYGSFRPAAHWYIDGLLGYGVLSFDINRYLDRTAEYASGRRDGRQLFASLASGYEFTGQGWQLAPYAKLDLIRPTLNQYSENTSAAGRAQALTYFRQTIRSSAASLGLRGELRYETPLGLLTPQLAMAYQHTLQGPGQAGIAYAESAAAGPAYFITDTAVDSSQWLSTVGGRLVLKNNVTLTLLYMRNLANSAVMARGLTFTLEGRF